MVMQALSCSPDPAVKCRRVWNNRQQHGRCKADCAGQQRQRPRHSRQQPPHRLVLLGQVAGGGAQAAASAKVKQAQQQLVLRKKKQWDGERVRVCHDVKTAVSGTPPQALHLLTLADSFSLAPGWAPSASPQSCRRSYPATRQASCPCGCERWGGAGHKHGVLSCRHPTGRSWLAVPHTPPGKRCRRGVWFGISSCLPVSPTRLLHLASCASPPVAGLQWAVAQAAGAWLQHAGNDAGVLSPAASLLAARAALGHALLHGGVRWRAGGEGADMQAGVTLAGGLLVWTFGLVHAVCNFAPMTTTSSSTCKPQHCTHGDDGGIVGDAPQEQQAVFQLHVLQHCRGQVQHKGTLDMRVQTKMHKHSCGSRW